MKGYVLLCRYHTSKSCIIWCWWIRSVLLKRREMTMKSLLKIISLKLWIVDWNERYGGKNDMIVMVWSLDCKSALWPWIQPLQKLNRSNTMDNNDRNSFITYINNKCTSNGNHMETKTRQRFLLFTTFTINALTTRNCDIEINEFSKWCSTNISYY